jgi:hypothetical protein
LSPVLEKSVKVEKSWLAGVNIEVLDLKTNITTSYNSIRGAARAIGIEHSTVRKYLASQTPYNNRYMFKKNYLGSD